MTLSPRVKLLLIAAGFALPIVASFTAYHFTRPDTTGNYGELLLPPAKITAQALEKAGGGAWRFSELSGRWILVVVDSGGCSAACGEKLTTLRQVHLALGRNATRVVRVFVAADGAEPDAGKVPALEGMVAVRVPAGAKLAAEPPNDRAHSYLVDPLGNVMMRWPAIPDRKRMLRDLERLLKASQIG